MNDIQNMKHPKNEKQYLSIRFLKEYKDNTNANMIVLHLPSYIIDEVVGNMKFG